MAPPGNTRASPASRARSRMRSVTATVSFTGWVLGMATMVVNPPAAAARAPVAMVSLYS